MAIRKFISSYLIFFYFFFNLLFIFYFFFFSFFFFSLSLSLPSPSPFHYSILFVFIVPVKFMSTFSILLVKFHRQSADRSKNLDIYMDKEESGKKRNRQVFGLIISLVLSCTEKRNDVLLTGSEISWLLVQPTSHAFNNWQTCVNGFQFCKYSTGCN